MRIWYPYFKIKILFQNPDDVDFILNNVILFVNTEEMHLKKIM